MRIDFSCPISGEQRDNNAVRIVALLSLITAIAALIVAFLNTPTIAAIITGVLALDFIIRAFYLPRYSPLATLSRGIVSGLNLPKKMVDSAPKVFAARIGVAFSVTSTILFAFGLLTAGAIVIGILIICAFLESALSLCLGCIVYSLLPKRIGNALAHDFAAPRAG